MRGSLRRFHAQYYSASLMTVVVLGKEPLDTLQSWVASSFAEMPLLDVPRPSFASLPPPFAGARGTTSGVDGDAVSDAPPSHAPPLWVHAIPLMERRRLELNWYVPSLLGAHRCKPDAYVVHVLGHEASGSVLWELKDEGLATGLCAGCDEDEHTSNAAHFSVCVDLVRAAEGDVLPRTPCLATRTPSVATLSPPRHTRTPCLHTRLSSHTIHPIPPPPRRSYVLIHLRALAPPSQMHARSPDASRPRAH